MKRAILPLIWQAAKLVYRTILRDLLIDAIDNPDKQWDDVVLKAVDAIFGYDADE